MPKGSRMSARVTPPQDYLRLEGSERKRAPAARRVGPAVRDEKIFVSIYLRRRGGAGRLPGMSDWTRNPLQRPKHLSRAEFARKFGASQADLRAVASFAEGHGLKVEETNVARRWVHVSGTVEQMNAAFAVDLGHYKSPNEEYRGREGFIHLPAALARVVVGVFGLDNRRVGHRNGDPTNTVALTPPQVAGLYNFPTNSASGQTIGLVALGGGYQQSDITKFYNSLGSAFTSPTITDVSIDGVKNSPTTTVTVPPSSSPTDQEVTLDVCTSSSVGQGAALAVYFTTATQKGWVDAITRAVHPNSGDPAPSVVSSSFYICNGDDSTTLSNSGISTGFLDAVSAAFQDAATVGVTIFVASGDTGTDSKVQDGKAHVQYPATDPWITAVGGTTIGNISGSTFTEVTWNDTAFAGGKQGASGGGVSDYFDPPAWQNGANVPPSINDDKRKGRGVPDVAANSSAASGYTLWVNGIQGTYGGTSAAAPLYAGLIAIINAALGEQVGYLNPLLYALAAQSGQTVCRDIADGGNNSVSFTISGKTTSSPGYTAGAGWDPCTGLGVLDGTQLLNQLQLIYAKRCRFLVQKATFGSDEVDALLKTGGGTFAQAFWVRVEGLTPAQLGINSAANLAAPPIIPQIAFNPSFAGLSVQFAGPVLPEDPSLPNQVQMFLFPFNVTFANDSGFVSSSETVNLTATLTSKTADSLTGVGQLTFVKKADPYVLNGATAWLSTDLRVFTAQANESRFGATMGGNAAAAPAFIASVIKNLTSNNGNVNGDAFDGLGDQSKVVSDPGAAEKTEALYLFPTNESDNLVFNFAIARVRLQGLSLTAQATRVFFRLFQAQTTAVSYVAPGAAPGVGPYRAFSDGTTYGRKVPLFGTQGGEFVTVPCFATARVANTSLASNMTTQTDSPNVQNIAPNPSGTEVDTYFGCWLDFNQQTQFVPFVPPSSNLDGPYSGQPLLSLQEVFIRSPHQCLVAEVAFDDVPIPKGADPSDSDKLAQRNLAFVDAPNPGIDLSRRAPQTFEIRPTRAALYMPAGALPDELVIDWGRLPLGTNAAIYLPAASADEILESAARLYITHRLSRLDDHTLQCPASGLTYLPVPAGTDAANFAGLLSIDLPDTIHKGDGYNVVVRQFTNAFGKVAPPPPPPPKINVAADATSGATNEDYIAWRKAIGAFQVAIPIKTKSVMREPEERLLSVLRWIEKSIPSKNRWYPVFQRYVGQIADRVKGLGGDPEKVGPSPTGEWKGQHPKREGDGHYRVDECFDHDAFFTGKVEGIIYDRFGDFEGFFFETECGERRRFYTRDDGIFALVRRAWSERMLVTVIVRRDAPHRPASLVLLGPPRRLEY